jgi:hypothetical protein
MVSRRQFTIAYLLVEVALVATALSAGRLAFAHAMVWIELQTLCLCIAATASCGALGGLCSRMTLGLIAGSVLSVAAIPSLCLLIGN